MSDDHWIDLHNLHGRRVIVNLAQVTCVSEGTDVVGDREIPCVWLTFTNTHQLAVRETVEEMWGES